MYRAEGIFVWNAFDVGGPKSFMEYLQVSNNQATIMLKSTAFFRILFMLS